MSIKGCITNYPPALYHSRISKILQQILIYCHQSHDSKCTNNMKWHFYRGLKVALSSCQYCYHSFQHNVNLSWTRHFNTLIPDVGLNTTMTYACEKYAPSDPNQMAWPMHAPLLSNHGICSVHGYTVPVEASNRNYKSYIYSLSLILNILFPSCLLLGLHNQKMCQKL